ncbi:TetR/AcrR family transcriptional regulator [Nocardioidaceae bacterium]|nr:TetR/AcrR family transcriptional regulator [Nocardioidaceae bacterium]
MSTSSESPAATDNGTARPRRKRVRLTHDQRAAQLLEIAGTLFTSHGYENVSIEDIARAAGVTRPVIYQHYGSKDGIYLACVEQVSAEFMDQLTVAREEAGGDLVAFIELGTSVLFDLLVEHPGAWALLFGATLTEGGPLAEKMSELRFGAVDRMGELAAEFVPGADRDALDAFANAVSGIADSFGRWWLRRPDLPREAVEHYFRVFVKGAMSSAAHAMADRPA